MLAINFIALLLLNVAFAIKTGFWVDNLLKTHLPGTVTIRHHRLGKNYLRGFPRGTWGSVLFPVLPVIPVEKLQEEYFKPIFGDIFNSNSTASESFKQFKDAVKKKFCSKNDKSFWKCCEQTSKRSDCDNVPDNAKNLMNSLIDPIQGMPLIFLYQWCTVGWAKYHEMNDPDEKKALRTNLEAACPDTCLGNPCQRIPFVNNTAFCEVTGSFENDFKCDCKKTAQWDQNLRTCMRKNPCLNEEYPPCVANNTLRCVAFDDVNVTCICKSEYMGTDCSLKRNACFERLNKSMPTGNENCRVSLGNECNGILGTDSYNCTCQYGHEPLLGMPEDNCFARRDPCQNFYAIPDLNKYAIDVSKSEGLVYSEKKDFFAALNGSNPDLYLIHRGVTCLNGGQCITSADMTRAVCLCPTAFDGSPLFSGPNCEIPVGSWSGWSSMSPCFPRDCGQTRYRWRRRRCLNTTTQEDLLDLGSKSRLEEDGVLANYSPPIRCIGTSEEVLPCDPLDPCMILRLPGYLRGEILNYGTLYHFLIITGVYLVVSLLSWYVFATPVLNALEKRRRKPAAVVIQRASTTGD